MQYVDDCLFKTSVSVGIEGDADMRSFNADAERSFSLYAIALGLELNSTVQDCWKFPDTYLEFRQLAFQWWGSGDGGRDFHLSYFRDAYSDYFCFGVKTSVLRKHLFAFLKKEMQRGWIPVPVDQRGEYIFDLVVGDGHLTTAFLHSAFSDAHANGLWEIDFTQKSYPLTGLSLHVCIEVETNRNIYQYHWRSRWVLTLVNFLVNSQKTSMRIFPKGAEIIRLIGLRLSKKLSRPR